MLKCKDCEYFDTVPSVMKWSICRKISDITGHVTTILKGPDSACTRKGLADIYQPVVKGAENDL